jgi:hypothetical protein
MRRFLAVAVLLALGALPAHADALTRLLKKGADYDSVRAAILTAGYKPQPEPQGRSEFCATGDARCETYPEAESCAGTGVAPCRMVWSKGRGGLIIFTEGAQARIRSIERQR